MADFAARIAKRFSPRPQLWLLTPELQTHDCALAASLKVRSKSTAATPQSAPGDAVPVLRRADADHADDD